MFALQGEISLKNRCAWVRGQPEIYIKYHDEEWGVPMHDDRLLFQKLVLEGAQAGLSWLTILKKRDAYKEAFDNFEFEKIAGYDSIKIEQLMQNTGIVRNRLKIKSAINNAKIFIKMIGEYGTFDNYLWQFSGYKPINNCFKSFSDIPTDTKLSKLVSDDLKIKGMSFVGPKIIYAYTQAIGMVNDHTVDCFRFNEIFNMETR